MNARPKSIALRLALPNASATGRGAFTLLEVLLALSLSVVLLVAVYGAFDLYLRFAAVGHDDIAQSQIARAVLRKMSADIRSVVYRPTTSVPSSDSGTGSGSSGQSGSSGGSSGGSNSSGGGSGSGGSGSSSGNSSSGSGGSSGDNSTPQEATTVDATAAFSRAMTGLVGDATTLVLHVARASRSVPQPEQTLNPVGLPTNFGDEKSISYFLADTGADGLAGIVADSYKKANGTAGDIQGLARLEGNRLAIQIADEQSNTEMLAENAKLLAPEVTDLEFRYFDGVDWLESWDSGVSQGLPQAVEITLSVRRTGKTVVKSTSKRDVEPPGDVYHLTVAIPSAEPYVAPLQ